MMPIGETRSDPVDPLLILSETVKASAEYYMGIPYKWGGNPDKENYADCSHLVTAILTRSLSLEGIKPHPSEMNTALIMEKTHPISNKDVKPGDVIFFKMSKEETGFNVGIITNTKNVVEFAHVSTKRGVISTSFKEGSWIYYWKKRFHSFRRWNSDIFESTKY
jgi:cell wall-associated NlpC family hydrolase